jgi:hypothetical protein
MSNHSERKHDKALEDTFPASDPPANSGITGSEQPDEPSHKEPSHKSPIDERATGTPTSDRRGTAHHSEHHAKDGKPAA